MKHRLEPSLGGAKLLLCLAAIVDVERRGHPARDDAVLVADRHHAREVEAILVPPGPDPVFEFTRGRGLEGLRKAPLDLLPILGVHGDEGPLVAQRFLLAQSGELDPPIVHPLQSPLGVARPDDLGQRVGELPVVGLAV